MHRLAYVVLACVILPTSHAEWLTPSSVVSATCTQNGAHGGEPSGTCNADETQNAAAFINGGETNLRAASGSSKSYTFVYDLGAEFWLEEAKLQGRSTGHWCEDTQQGGSYCHNDNGFSVAFSLDGTLFGAYNDGFNTTDSCGRLDDGCGWSFWPRRARYARLRVNSGCSGCSNNDYLTRLSFLEARVTLDMLSSMRTVVGWVAPRRVVSAHCRSTEAPDGTNNEFGLNDPGAKGGEPAGTCESDERSNAEAILWGAPTTFRGASGSGKEYYVVYDLGEPILVDSIELEGWSTGHWCEDDAKGASSCHNDNGFYFAFSTDGASWGGYNHGFNVTDQCNRLHDGCGWVFAPQSARYVKLAVVSSCSGCNNRDFVTAMRFRQAHSASDAWLAARSLEGRLAALESSVGLLHVTRTEEACRVQCGDANGAAVLELTRSAKASSGVGRSLAVSSHGRELTSTGVTSASGQGPGAPEAAATSLDIGAALSPAEPSAHHDAAAEELTKAELTKAGLTKAELTRALAALQASEAQAAASEARAVAAEAQLASLRQRAEDEEARVAALGKQLGDLLIEKRALLDTCSSSSLPDAAAR